ncbi:MAG: hypothetical protein R2827_12835 [Bdellovibrionales bacterium]
MESSSAFDPDLNGIGGVLAFNGTDAFIGGGFTLVNRSTTAVDRNRLASFDPVTGAISAFPVQTVDGDIYAMTTDGTSIFYIRFSLK